MLSHADVFLQFAICRWVLPAGFAKLLKPPVGTCCIHGFKSFKTVFRGLRLDGRT